MNEEFDWEEACRFLMTFVPKRGTDVPKGLQGLGAMFPYGTLSEEGDETIKNRTDEILDALNRTGRGGPRIDRRRNDR